MARPVSNNAVLEVANLGSLFGETVMNVWHYVLATPAPGSLDGDALVAKAQAALQPGAGPRMLVLLRGISSEPTTWSSVRYQWIWPTRYSPVLSNSGSGAGTRVGFALPSNVAAVAQLKTTLAIRGGQGRKHFAGLTENDVANNLLQPLYIADMGELLTFMGQSIDCTTVSANTYLHPIVYHRSNPNLSQIWSEIESKAGSRVMRRRTFRVGQ